MHWVSVWCSLMCCIGNENLAWYWGRGDAWRRHLSDASELGWSDYSSLRLTPLRPTIWLMLALNEKSNHFRIDHPAARRFCHLLVSFLIKAIGCINLSFDRRRLDFEMKGAERWRGGVDWDREQHQDKIRTCVSPIRNLNLTGSPKRSLSMLIASDTWGECNRLQPELQHRPWSIVSSTSLPVDYSN